jgi:hypothetical protein
VTENLELSASIVKPFLQWILPIETIEKPAVPNPASSASAMLVRVTVPSS